MYLMNLTWNKASFLASIAMAVILAHFCGGVDTSGL